MFLASIDLKSPSGFPGDAGLRLLVGLIVVAATAALLAVILRMLLRATDDEQPVGGTTDLLFDSFARHRIPILPVEPLPPLRDIFEEVSDVYRRAYAAGEAPICAVADYFGISHAAAARWVSASRYDYGLLPKTSRGRAIA